MDKIHELVTFGVRKKSYLMKMRYKMDVYYIYTKYYGKI